MSIVRAFSGVLTAAVLTSVALSVGSGCSAPPDSEGEGTALAEDGLTASDVAIVGDLEPSIDPAPIAYVYPKRYRALTITSVTSIEELDLEISADDGTPQAWIVDTSYRAVATSTTVIGVGARLQWHRTSVSTTRSYFLLLRESTLKKTVFHVHHKCNDDDPTPPTPACTPTTCAAHASTCGSISDGCGGTLDCGSCTGGATCSNNKCITPAPSTCKNPSTGATLAQGALCNWAEENANQGHPEGICVSGGCHQGCFIDGKYYWVTQQNPANPCQICAPTSSTATRVGWSDVQPGYESYYPTCTACTDYQGKRTIPSGGTCYNFEYGRSGTCNAGKCN